MASAHSALRFAVAAASAMSGRRRRARRASARTVATAIRSTQWGSQAVGPPCMYSVRSIAPVPFVRALTRCSSLVPVGLTPPKWLRMKGMTVAWRTLMASS